MENISSDDLPLPEPFIGNTIDEIYEFFTHNLRPNVDSTAPENMTYFTFVAVDAQCITSSPPECIICCDAPDFQSRTAELTNPSRPPF